MLKKESQVQFSSNKSTNAYLEDIKVNDSNPCLQVAYRPELRVVAEQGGFSLLVSAIIASTQTGSTKPGLDVG